MNKIFEPKDPLRVADLTEANLEQLLPEIYTSTTIYVDKQDADGKVTTNTFTLLPPCAHVPNLQAKRSSGNCRVCAIDNVNNYPAAFTGSSRYAKLQQRSICRLLGCSDQSFVIFGVHHPNVFGSVPRCYQQSCSYNGRRNDFAPTTLSDWASQLEKRVVGCNTPHPSHRAQKQIHRLDRFVV
jgi:hypothetical protein